MSELVVETPEGVALRFEIAGVGTRLLAASLDGLVFALVLLLGVLFFLVAGVEPGYVWLVSGTFLWLAGYSFVFSMLWNGRTPGKVWQRIRVFDESGTAASVTQHFVRSLFVPFEAVLVFPIALSWILIAATPRHQRFGDLVAGTLVLREGHERLPVDLAPRLTWSTLTQHVLPLEPAQAREFEGRDLGFLRQLLGRDDLDPGERARLEHRAAQHFAERLGPEALELAAQEPRTLLRELFLFLREMRAANLANDRVTRPAAGAGDRDSSRGAGSPRR